MCSGVKLAAWMDDGSAIGASRQALDALGILAVDAPPDLALRALATRTLLRPTAVIALSAGASTLQLVSLDVTRRAHERLTDLPVRDGTLAAAAGALAGALDESRAPAIDEVDDVVRRASGDASIAAAHRLSAQLAKTAVRAAIVSAKADGFVVAVARTPRRRMVIVSPLSGSAEWRTERRASFAACYDAPVVPGVCESPER